MVFGVALEVNRLASRARNFLFVFFDQEEDDEVGSRAFVRYLENKRYEVHSVHVVDLAHFRSMTQLVSTVMKRLALP